MAVIARWTTPSVLYKPSMVEMDNVSEIYLTIKQGGVTVVTKTLEDADVTEDGFLWTLTQEETSNLAYRRNAIIQVDYKTLDAMRYTTVPKEYMIGDSGIQEVI